MGIAGSYSSGQLDILQPRMSERGNGENEGMREVVGKWGSGRQEHGGLVNDVERLRF